jgi:Domain of unknown function (DUF4359)
MKISTIITFLGVAAVAASGVAMAKTNPSETEYQAYATQELTEYAKANVCKKTPSFISKLINSNCENLLESANPQMRDLIASSTQRHDFVIFSLYRTEFKLNSWLPSYKFESVGALDNFYTYKAEKQ